MKLFTKKKIKIKYGTITVIKREQKFRFMSFIFIALLSIMIGGCDAPFTENLPPENKLKTINVYANQNINGKFALSLSLVQVFNKDVFTLLKTMDADTFKTKKDQILLDHPDGLTIWNVDFIENENKCFEFSANRNYWGIIVYLHFLNNPQNRIVIPMKLRKVGIQIHDETFSMFSERHSSGYTRLKEGDEYNVSSFS